MFKNYLTIALRNILRHKTYSFIKVFGLAIGFSTTIFILLSIQYEFSFDRFHEKGDHIYRVYFNLLKEGRLEEGTNWFVPPLAPTMYTELPEVIDYTRIRNPISSYFKLEAQQLKVEQVLYVDSSFFNLFSFPLLFGDMKNVLKSPNSIVLTETIARQFFGDENPMGKILEANSGDLYTVTGIAKDAPPNSHIQFNMLISFSTLYNDPYMHMGWNGGNQYAHYIRLSEKASLKTVKDKLPDFMWRHIGELYYRALGSTLEASLQPLKDIHLFYEGNRMIGIYIIITIASLVLIIACINFVNLSTAFSAKRAKEIGVRKVIGADRNRLIRQFLFESIIISVLSLIFAMLFVELFFPIFSELVNHDVNPLNLSNLKHLLGLILLALLVGASAGMFPAFYLSSLQPVKTLNQTLFKGVKKGKLQNGLMVFQYSISIALIICTILIHHQLQYIQNKSLGFKKENLLVLSLGTETLKEKYPLLKNEMLQYSDIICMTASSDVPYRGFTMNGYLPEGFQESQMIHVVDSDEDFLTTFQIPISEGIFFSEDLSADDDAYIINETCANVLGWEQPLGKSMRRDGQHIIIGVVNDFHFSTMHDRIEPLIITNRPGYGGFRYLTLQMASSDLSTTMSYIKKTWEQIVPSEPFEFFFLDEAVENLYKTEEHFKRLFLSSSLLAILIAVLGLFSLVSLSTEYRTKEIGIRKAFGASVIDIIKLISKEFVISVLVANAIAWPIAWIAGQKWLEMFAYRINMGWWMFVLAGVLALVIALLTVSFKGIMAATANPVDALRYE